MYFPGNCHRDCLYRKQYQSMLKIEILNNVSKTANIDKQCQIRQQCFFSRFFSYFIFLFYLMQHNKQQQLKHDGLILCLIPIQMRKRLIGKTLFV